MLRFSSKHPVLPVDRCRQYVEACNNLDLHLQGLEARSRWKDTWSCLIIEGSGGGQANIWFVWTMDDLVRHPFKTQTHSGCFGNERFYRSNAFQTETESISLLYTVHFTGPFGFPALGQPESIWEVASPGRVDRRAVHWLRISGVACSDLIRGPSTRCVPSFYKRHQSRSASMRLFGAVGGWGQAFGGILKCVSVVPSI